MNSEVYKLNKASKKRSRIEQLLLVDHSDIYFENDKLGDRLTRFLLQLRKEHHKSVILRDNEIRDLNREIENFRAILETSALTRKLKEEAEKLEELPENTNDSPENIETDNQYQFKRRLRAITPDVEYRHLEGNHKVRIKSSLEIYQEERIQLPRSRSLSPINDREKDSFLGPRSVTSISGFNRRRKVKEQIDTSDFPAEWFTTVVPASDAVLARVRRHKSAPLHQQLKMMRSRKGKPKEEEERVATPTDEPKENEETEKSNGLSVICNTPVKPVVMSLRQLKEIANIDNLAEQVPNKHEILLKERIDKAKEHFDVLEARCKAFIEEIKRKTETDLKVTNPPKDKTAVEDDIYAGVEPPS